MKQAQTIQYTAALCSFVMISQPGKNKQYKQFPEREVNLKG